MQIGLDHDHRQREVRYIYFHCLPSYNELFAKLIGVSTRPMTMFLHKQCAVLVLVGLQDVF